jgi:hypothetical protein
MSDTPKQPEQDPLELDNLPPEEVQGDDVKGGLVRKRTYSTACNTNTLTCTLSKDIPCE